MVGNYSGQISEMGINIKALTQYGYDVIVFAGQLPIFSQMDNGQYYVELGDGVQTWYSEIFTVVNDISGYLKLEWWDNEDFTMEAPSTKGFVQILNNLQLEGKKVLVVVAGADKNLYLSSRNLQKTKLAAAANINTYGILDAGVMVVTESALNTIHEVLA